MQSTKSISTKNITKTSPNSKTKSVITTNNTDSPTLPAINIDTTSNIARTNKLYKDCKQLKLLAKFISNKTSN